MISGLAKGRRLKAPRGHVTRPMTDRAREGVFSAIAAALPGSDVLDLYAGTGSLGLEALSRGSASAVFVERDRIACQVLRANVELVGLGGRVIGTEVDRFLADSSAGRGTVHTLRFDVVFVDPPYRHSRASVEATLRSVTPLVRIGGTVVVHRLAGEQQPEVLGLELQGRHRYGSTRIWRYMRVRVSDKGRRTTG